MGGAVRSVLGGLGMRQVRFVRPVSRGAARGLVARVYREVERDFGVLAPPMTLHSPAPASLAAAWSMLRATLLAPGALPRPVKEAVATAVSLGNSCPFCVTVHSGTFRSMGGSDATALEQGRIDAIADPDVRAAATWALSCGSAATATPAPFPAAQVPGLVALVLKMQYLNRMVNVFLPEAPLPPGAPKIALGPVMSVLGHYMRDAATRTAAPDPELLPPAAVPADLGWAEGDAAVADAFARACAAVDAGGRQAVPEGVRELVTAEVAAWTGETRGPSRAWVSDAVSALPAAERPAGRLALLVALGSHQIDEPVITDVGCDDETLVQLTSWAALTAARRVAGWVPVPAARRLRPTG